MTDNTKYAIGISICILVALLNIAGNALAPIHEIGHILVGMLNGYHPYMDAWNHTTLGGGPGYYEAGYLFEVIVMIFLVGTWRRKVPSIPRYVGIGYAISNCILVPFGTDVDGSFNVLVILLQVVVAIIGILIELFGAYKATPSSPVEEGSQP